MKKKIKRTLVVSLLLLTMTGCTTYLKDDDNKNVVNPHTGQNLTENILCRPTDEETIKIYEENGINVTKEDLDAEYTKIAENYKMEVEKVKEALASRSNELVNNIFMSKIHELLVNSNKFVVKA